MFISYFFLCHNRVTRIIQDQLISTTPVSGGMGMHLLQKMGWKPGEGLGKEKNGSLQPLLLEVKLDKKGLVAEEEVETIVQCSYINSFHFSISK